MGSIYLPPIARKKKVDGCPRHNTSRVFADLQGNLPVQTSYEAHYVGHALEISPLQSLSDGRKNKPHPNNVTFLRQNPRFICEPICHVKTSYDPKDTLHPWWPEEVPAGKPIKVPQWSFDSTTRSDYFSPSTLCERPTRYSSDNMANKPAVGIIPQFVKSDSNQTAAKEKISYEHQFNSRLDPSQPIRGRRHGSFIWKDVCQKETGKFEVSTLRDEKMTNGGLGNHEFKDSNSVRESQPGSNNN